MTWCGELALLAAALGGELPEAVVDRVRDAVAATWAVAADRVVVEWGRIPDDLAVADSASVRLLGTGRGGRFVAAIRTGSGETALAFRAGIRETTWVAARALPMGRRLEAADVQPGERVVWGPAAEAGNPVGWELRRNLRAGEPLVPPVVAEPPLVEVGDEVSLVWERPGFRVVRTGLATSRARRGERVALRDERTGDQLYGIVTGPGTARIEGKGIR
ncbi:MAG: flagellar basal body P-ring formation chaperone FlgA [Gemmatimonadales bacterium]